MHKNSGWGLFRFRFRWKFPSLSAEFRFRAQHYEDEWEIEAIVDERRLGRGWQYRVTYAGWGEEDAQWRSRSELRETAPELVARWEEVHPK